MVFVEGVKCQRQFGFSLIEVLIVLLIIGVASTLTFINLKTDNHQERNRAAAEQFSRLAQWAADQSLLSGEILGLMIVQRESELRDAQGYVLPARLYHWRRYRDDQWQPLESDVTESSFPPESEVLLEVEGDMIDWNRFDASRPAINTPVALVYPSGEATSLSLLLRSQQLLRSQNPDQAMSTHRAFEHVSISPAARVFWQRSNSSSTVQPSIPVLPETGRYGY